MFPALTRRNDKLLSRVEDQIPTIASSRKASDGQTNAGPNFVQLAYDLIPFFVSRPPTPTWVKAKPAHWAVILRGFSALLSGIRDPGVVGECCLIRYFRDR
jgi:hypothetical protein